MRKTASTVNFPIAVRVALTVLVVGSSQIATPSDAFSAHPANEPSKTATQPLVAVKPTPIPAPKWRALFDGKSLADWSKTQFGGEGDVDVEDGKLVLNFGGYMTGITYTGEELPKTNYEIEMVAARIDGIDFFSGLTFPVKDSFCSLILGGWGGGVCGLSSIDQMDASENDTTQFRLFNQGEWYRVKVRVLDDRILAWLDGERIVDQEITDREVGIRPEVELSRPLGIATYQTTGAVRELKIRKLDPSELPESTESSAK